MKYNLKPAFETSLKHEAFTCDMIESEGIIFVIRFEGRPGVGGEGNFDAMYVISTVRTILESRVPQAVVVDFTKVHYEFGNGMMKALDLTDQYGLQYFPETFPHAVVGRKSSNPLYRLIRVLGFKKHMFTDLESALLYVENEYEKQNSRELSTTGNADKWPA